VYGKPEKRGGEKQETEIGEIYATLPKILKSKSAKRQEPTKKGGKSPGLKRTGSRKCYRPFFYPQTTLEY